jgi:hypothetical protein
MQPKYSTNPIIHNSRLLQMRFFIRLLNSHSLSKNLPLLKPPNIINQPDQPILISHISIVETFDPVFDYLSSILLVPPNNLIITLIKIGSRGWAKLRLLRGSKPTNYFDEKYHLNNFQMEIEVTVINKGNIE